mgnify:CR=1 FL=1
MIFSKAIDLAKKRLGNKNFEGLEIDFQHVEEENLLRVKKENCQVVIEYNQLASAFRGLSLIKEHKGEKNFNVSLKKHFTTNGYMLDCSRNGVVKVDILKDQIISLALMGMNRLLLYTEDTYKLDKYPYFGYLRGGYTKEDIKELVEFGEGFGVELIPCIQTLGHLERPLRWEPMMNLNDGVATLMVGEPKVYEFIEEMIKFCRECFHSTDIHIGMDESFELGVGKYLGKHPFTDRVTLFSSHIKAVIEICKKYDFSPMIWSDMYFRLNASDSEYYRTTPLPQSTIDMIPKEVGLVYWDYYHSDKKIYDDMISFHKQTPNDIHFAGGAGRWKGFAPAIRGSFTNTIPALQSCVENNIKNVFVTGWGDNGNECSIYATLPVIALYSVFDYFGICDEDKVSSLLEAVEDETLERMLLLDLPDRPAKKVLLPQYNASKFLFYQDPLNGFFDLQVKPEFAKNYAEFAGILEKASKESKKYGYVYKNLSLFCSALSIKADLGVRLRNAYKQGNKPVLKDIVNKDIPLLIKIIDIFGASTRTQWMYENRPFGYDVIDGRLGYLKNRLESTKLTVNQYIGGTLERIEELETEILPFNGHDYETCWNWWVQTVTVHNL